MAAAVPFTVVGKAIPRVEGPDKVVGRATYSADVTPRDVLWARNVRSPYPHARIVAIKKDRALAVPGVRAVLTAADFPNRLIGRRLKDNPVLCGDRVRFVGDKVAVVVADAPDAAEEGALRVDVEYQELPAVFDPVAAMEPGAPLVHPDVRSYVGFDAEIPAGIPNVCAYQVWGRGDPADGFREADVVVENTFRTHLSHQGYLEPSSFVVAITNRADGRGDRVEVWATNKVPFNLRSELATIIDRPEDDILIHPVTVGADFGSKGAPGDIATAYYLARQLGRPVKFVNSANEDLTATSPRHPSVVTLRSGARRDGTIVAWDARVIFNSGAYGAFKPSANGMLGGAARAAGVYQIPNFRIEAYCIYTNQVPCGYMRAPGSPQVLYAVEAQIDLLARELGMDPVELRERNLPRRTHDGREDVSRQVLREAALAIDWDRRTSSRRSADGTRLVGRGVSIVMRQTGVGEGSSDVTVNPDGTITAVTAMPDNGTGGLTVVAQVVAESFGVPMSRVRLVRGSTDALPVDVGAGASRMTNVAGHAAIDACEQVKAQLTPLAAQALGAAEADWVRAGASGTGQGGWRAPNGRFLSLEDLATEMVRPGDPAAHAQVTITTPRSPDVGYCTQAAEVEVDPETGEVRVCKMASVQDVGTIINAIGHQGQIEGAIVQGMGYAMMEELATDQGRITTGNFGDYKVPTMRDLPELTTVNIRTTGPGPFESKAIGEIPIMPTAGALANAVADAIGAPITELPITPERVLNALERVNA
ncbi:MAG TPA: xanthine dehydrogenase family protein molybdopterin-binding subunit [Chloroflexota bacterium]|nr:xanthine dehydrogenase family protein molybdopterin-binding subunit [Chloroflexota bacterium]